jgi:biotin operon repressor
MITCRHKDKPIRGCELSTAIDIKDKDGKEGANLRSVINSLRDKGFPICANGDGYYYPENPQELEEYIESFQRRIDQQQEACDNLKIKHMDWVIAKQNQEARKEEPKQAKLIN